MKLTKYLSITGGTLLFIGFSGFLGAALLCCFIGGAIPPEMELPMGEMCSIAVDRAGNIYCASYSYGRIQVYDREGKFVRGMYVGGGGGRIIMYFDTKERLHVYVAKARILQVYHPDGTLAGKRKDEVAASIDSSINSTARDRDGNTYRIRTPSFYPRVFRITPEGQQSVIVAVPLYLLLFQGPMPAWCIGAIGMGLLVFRDALEKRVEKSAAGKKKPVKKS